MDRISIRCYEESDWMRLMEIHDQARRIELELAGLSEAFLPLRIAAEREGLFDYKLYVACRDQIPVGFVAFTEDEIAWLYVDPLCMRQGIGRALVRFAKDQIGEGPISIEVLMGNEPALRLYESLGFHVSKTVQGVMPGNEEYEVTVHVLKND